MTFSSLDVDRDQTLRQVSTWIAQTFDSPDIDAVCRLIAERAKQRRSYVCCALTARLKQAEYLTCQQTAERAAEAMRRLQPQMQVEVQP